MTNRLSRYSTLSFLVPLLLAAGVGDGLEAQSLGVGLVANAPSLTMGASVQGVLPVAGGFGLYFDAKLDFEDRSADEGFEPDLGIADAQAAGHVFRRDESSWQSFNLALVRPVAEALTLYAGAGWAHQTVYSQYQDLSGELGRQGYYWVEDTAETGPTVNLLGGAFLNLSDRLLFQFGAETAPGGFTVGFSYLLLQGGL